MAPKRPEPRRVPKARTTSPAERAGAGCLGLLVLPWFLSSLFSTFVMSVAAPMQGGEAMIGGVFSLLIFVPLAFVLGSVSMTAISRALGSSEPIRLAHSAAAGIPLSALAMFLIAAFISATMSATSLGAVLAGAGVLALLSAVAHFAHRARPKRERRRHASPPRPPWAHPLARTEKVNMYAEALADEYNVVVVLAATALSILLANPLPLLTVGGLELIYLSIVPDTQWFRRRVERKHRAMADEQAMEVREEQREFLATDQLQRHEEMVRHVERARQTMEAADYGFDVTKLERAVDHHLWLMQLENYYSDLDARTRLRELDRQIEAARADRAGMSGRMADILDTRLDVLGRRRRQIEQLDARLAEIVDKRRMLEETLPLVTESALAGSKSFDEIDEVLLDLEITEEVVLELHDEEDALEAEIEAAYEQATEAA